MPTSFEQISEMLVEMAPRLEVDEIAAFEEESYWVVVVDERVTIALDYAEAAGRLYLTAMLGTPPLESRAETYGFLLQYNRFWKDTEGLRMALDGPEGEAMQIFDIGLDGLDGGRLQTVFENFANLARTMRALVEEGIGGDGKEEAALPGAEDMAGWLRA